MSIAYLILAHKNPGQLARLISALNTRRANFFIHIDSKADLEKFKLALKRCGSIRIRLVRREDGQWGGMGIVRAVLNGLALYRCKRSERHSHVVLLSGQCYPLRQVEEIEAFFEANRDNTFMNYFPLPSDNWTHDGMDRIERFHWRFMGRLFTYPPYEAPRDPLVRIVNTVLHHCISFPRFLPYGLRPFGGADWWTLSDNGLRYVIHWMRDHPEYLHFHKHTFMPSEGFFQTILMNARDDAIINSVVEDNLRYIDWSAGGRHPKTFACEHVIHLMKSGKFFARKFDSEQDSSFLDLLDRWRLRVDEVASSGWQPGAYRPSSTHIPERFRM